MRLEVVGLNWRAVIGYGPLIIESADVMTNGFVLVLAEASDLQGKLDRVSAFLLLNHI